MIRLNKALNLLNLQGGASDFDTILWTALLSWRTLEKFNGQILMVVVVVNLSGGLVNGQILMVVVNLSGGLV